MENIEEYLDIKLTVANKLIVEEAISRGVTIKKMPKERFKLEYGTNSYIIKKGIVSNSFNHRLAQRCTRLKEITSRLLRSKGFPAPENVVFSTKDLERAWSWAQPILPVVL